MDSVVAALVKLCHGTWSLPRSGTEPVSPSLAGRFFTTEPAGKPTPPLLLCFNVRTFQLKLSKTS